MGRADAVGAFGAASRWAWAVAVAAGLARIAYVVAGVLSPDPDDFDCDSSWDCRRTSEPGRAAER